MPCHAACPSTIALVHPHSLLFAPVVGPGADNSKSRALRGRGWACTQSQSKQPLHAGLPQKFGCQNVQHTPILHNPVCCVFPWRVSSTPEPVNQHHSRCPTAPAQLDRRFRHGQPQRPFHLDYVNHELGCTYAGSKENMLPLCGPRFVTP